MGRLHLDGYDGKVKYAQLLHDGSEVLVRKKKGAWLDEAEAHANAITLELPVEKPRVAIPVVELFLN
jgi:alpha-L-fucosidase